MTLGGAIVAVVALVGYDAGNLPKFTVDGTARYPFIDVCGCSSGGGCDNRWQGDYVARAVRTVGPRILQMGLDDDAFLRDDGTFDWSALDRKALAALKIDPAAQLMVNIRFRYERWAAQHPDEAIVYSDGPSEKHVDEWSGRPLRPSAASLPFRRETLRAIGSMAAHVRSAAWGEHVVGVRLNYGLYTEWHSYGIFHGPDLSAPMTTAFRRYLSETYRTDAALQKAWGDPSATLATATVPTLKERTCGGYLMDPVKGRRTIDYWKTSAEAHLDLLLAQAEETKRVLPGRLVGAYYGYVLHGLPNEGATFLLDRALASPAIDFLSDPPDYSPACRLAGGDYAHRTVVASFHRYGKIALIEDDARLHYMTNWTGRCLKSADEDREVLKRNILNTLFDRCGYQVCDPIRGTGRRPHSFDNPNALAAQRTAFDALGKVRALPANSGVDMALVVDYRDRFYTDIYRGYTPGSDLPTVADRSPGYDLSWHVYCAAPRNLHLSGAVFDILTLDDLLATKKTYRRLVFLNGYALEGVDREKVKARARRAGTTAVWFVAPGSILPDGFSDAAMSDLVGMGLAGAGVNPKVACTEKGVTAFAAAGGGWEKRLSGGARTVFLPSVPNSPERMAELMDLIGEHRYVTEEAYVRRYGDYLMVHVGKGGRYRVTLPPAESGRSLVELFSGKAYERGVAELETAAAKTWFMQVK